MSTTTPTMEKMNPAYLANNVMQATRQTLALVSTVLMFDIAEMWYESDEGELKCTFVYAHDSFKRQFPDIITGHYPEHKREHKRSPTVRAAVIEVSYDF
jgi:hypothetical protein